MKLANWLSLDCQRAIQKVCGLIISDDDESVDSKDKRKKKSVSFEDAIESENEKPSKSENGSGDKGEEADDSDYDPGEYSSRISLICCSCSL